MGKRWGVLRIISGGQTGADMGGLVAARELGIETGGAAPMGWLTEDGPQEALLRTLGLVECNEPGYPVRTRLNVANSDGTVLVGQYRTGGSALTYEIAMEMKKPIFHIAHSSPTAMKPADVRIEEFRYWLERHEVRTLNVAGNRESESLGICQFTRDFLRYALRCDDSLE